MILEASTNVIESAAVSFPLIMAFTCLALGAVRLIPLQGNRLEVLDDSSSGAKDKTTPKMTKSGHAIIPDNKSASVGIYDNNTNFLQSAVYVEDRSAKKPGYAIIRRLKGNLVASISKNRPLVSTKYGFVAKFFPPKN